MRWFWIFINLRIKYVCTEIHWHFNKEWNWFILEYIKMFVKSNMDQSQSYLFYNQLLHVYFRKIQSGGVKQSNKKNIKYFSKPIVILWCMKYKKKHIKLFVIYIFFLCSTPPPPQWVRGVPPPPPERDRGAPHRRPGHK